MPYNLVPTAPSEWDDYMILFNMSIIYKHKILHTTATVWQVTSWPVTSINWKLLWHGCDVVVPRRSLDHEEVLHAQRRQTLQQVAYFHQHGRHAPRRLSLDDGGRQLKLAHGDHVTLHTHFTQPLTQEQLHLRRPHADSITYTHVDQCRRLFKLCKCADVTSALKHTHGLKHTQGKPKYTIC